MEMMTIVAIAACALSAGVVYVVLKIDYSGRNQTLTDQLLRQETELIAVKKQLHSYTRYADYLGSVLPLLADWLKSPVVTIKRDVTYVETVAKEKFKLRADVTVVSKYKLVFAFALDLNPAAVAITPHSNGLAVKLNRPTQFGEPKVELQARQVLSAQPPADDRALLAEVGARFQATLRSTATSLCDEDSVRSLCKLKVMEALRDALAQQPGVRQVPAILVDFR